MANRGENQQLPLYRPLIHTSLHLITCMENQKNLEDVWGRGWGVTEVGVGSQGGCSVCWCIPTVMKYCSLHYKMYDWHFFLEMWLAAKTYPEKIGS